MLPILLNFGPIKIYSYGLFLALGLFISLYWWWKMGRDEHFDEIELFDGFFLSVIVFFVISRVGYTIMNLGELGTWVRAFALHAYPGLDVVSGLLAVMIFMFFFSRSKGWDAWKVADAFVVALSMALLVGSLGGFLNGSIPGKEVSWGLMYPGESTPRIPADIWVLIWSIITFATTSRVRKNFRFYAWYKGESSMAQEGLASLVFGILAGIYFIVYSIIVDSSWLLFGKIPVETVVGFLAILISTLVIKKRVGRRESGLWGKLMNIIRRK